MRASTRKASGFTLVEILIVVVILGILAAIVIPQFTSASESAQASNVAAQLQTIRSQMQLYEVEHNGSRPDLSGADETAWEDMTVEHTGPGGGDVGPYLQQGPRNPFALADNDASVGSWDGAASTAGDASVAWQYDSASGRIRAVIENTDSNVDALTGAGLREGEDFVAVDAPA